MKKSFKPLCRENNLVVQSLQDDLLVYDSQSTKAYCLNKSSAAIWNACDGSNTVEEIAEKVSRQLDSPITDHFVWLALDQLQKENLLDEIDNFAPDFNGLSRRDVIKKVGLGTMVALPIVSSLLAPSSAMASSACIPAGQACSPGANPDQCCPGSFCEGTCVDNIG